MKLDHPHRYVRCLTIATVMTVGLAVSGVHAQEGKPYVSVSVGTTTAPDNSDSLNGKTSFNRGQELGIGVGYGLTNSVRIEGEILRAKVAIDTMMLPSVNGGNPQKASGSVVSTKYMLNALYDFDANLPVKPYVGAGVGIANISVNDSSAPGINGTNDSDRVMAWQFKIGASRDVTDNMTLDLGYRYFDAKRGSFTSKGNVSYTADGAKQHTVALALRYSF